MAKLRRKTVEASGIWEVLKQALADPTLQEGAERVQMQTGALGAARGLHAEEAFVRTYALPLTATGYPDALREAATRTLGLVKAPWASERLLQLLPQEYPDGIWESVVAALGDTDNPHNIPSLIAVMDADDSEDTLLTVNKSLEKPTGVTFTWDRGRDADWWRRWWDKNKAQYPADVATLTFPDLHLQNTPRLAGYIRRMKKSYEIANDPHRQYFLICPGLAGIRPKSNANAQPVAVTGEHGANTGAGLLVVLVGGDGNGERLAEYWLEAARKGMPGSYLVALAVAPRWSNKQPTAWITKVNQAAVPEATFVTETFVADIVKDVSARYPINPDKVFLHGEEEGGTAAYACSLDKSTPFKGFYILSAPFRSSLLPPLTHARNRRYVIQNSQTDKVVPYWMVTAGASLLNKQGATVKLSTYEGDHGYKFTGNSWQPMQDAMTWLESGTPAQRAAK